MYFDIIIDKVVNGLEFTGKIGKNEWDDILKINLVTDCTVYNFDQTLEYDVISSKCLDPYINARMLDGYTVARRARFSYTGISNNSIWL